MKIKEWLSNFWYNFWHPVTFSKQIELDFWEYYNELIKKDTEKDKL